MLKQQLSPSVCVWVCEWVRLRTCRCGHAASSVGSSSSGSNSAPVGLDDGGSVLNIFIANWKEKEKAGKGDNQQRLALVYFKGGFIFPFMFWTWKKKKHSQFVQESCIHNGFNSVLQEGETIQPEPSRAEHQRPQYVDRQKPHFHHFLENWNTVTVSTH